MKLIKECYNDIFPEKTYNYNAKIRYSSKFKDYNANIKYLPTKKEIVISLSKKWNKISKDIKKGLIQELLLKMFGKGQKIKTLNMDLYHIFLRNAHMSAEKKHAEPQLLNSFQRVNDTYFNGMIDLTNLIWGGYTKRTLGRYEYGSDTITISSIFKNSKKEFLDMIMHHEMLHKKHKFKNINGRNLHHSKEFRKAEKRFHNFEQLDKELKEFIRFYKIPRKKTTIKNTQNKLNKKINKSLRDFFGI